MMREVQSSEETVALDRRNQKILAFLIVVTLVVSLAAAAYVRYATANGNPTAVALPSPPNVSIVNSNITLFDSGKSNCTLSVGPGGSGTYYIAVVDNSTQVLSPLDMAYWSSAPLPQGMSVSYSVYGSPSPLGVINKGSYVEVNATSGFGVNATLSISGAPAQVTTLEVVVFQVTSGTTMGTLQQLQVEVEQ